MLRVKCLRFKQISLGCVVNQARYRHRIIRHSLKAVCFVGMDCYFEFAALKERPKVTGRSELYENACVKRCQTCIRSCNTRKRHSHTWLMLAFQRR